jgi:hypothetical protein
VPAFGLFRGRWALFHVALGVVLSGLCTRVESWDGWGNLGGRWSVGPCAVSAGLFVCLAAAAIAYSASRKSQRLVEVFLISPGAEAIDRLDALVAGADFSKPHGRARAVRELFAAVEAADVLDGRVRVRCASRSANVLAHRAGAIYQQRLQLAERWPAEVVGARAGEGSSPACVLGILMTLPEDVPVAEGGTVAVRALVSALQDRPATAPAALYLYSYDAPEPGEALTREQAQSLLGSLARA